MNSKSSSCGPSSRRAFPSNRAPQQGWHVARAERGPVLEEMGPSGFDTLEDPLATQPGQPQFEPQPAADAVADRAAFVKCGTREADAGFDRPSPIRRQRAARQVGFSR